MAATQDNLSQTPYIVPNSPTEKDQSKSLYIQIKIMSGKRLFKVISIWFCLDFNEAVGSPMDTSGPPEDPPQERDEEPMDMDPCPKPQPTASTPVSQNSPGLVLEKSLSVPSQPEFSHVSINCSE